MAMGNDIWFGLGNTLSFNEPKTSLGIRSVRFDGDDIEATMADGTKKKVNLPKGWRVQALHSALIFQCPCGEFVLGVPYHECLEKS